MKRSFKVFITLLALIFFSKQTVYADRPIVKSNKEYLITGKITGAKDGWIYLVYGEIPKMEMRRDSSWMTNGEFKFSGKLDHIQTFLVGAPALDKNGKVMPRAIMYKGPYLLVEGNTFVEGILGEGGVLKAQGTWALAEYNAFVDKTKILDNQLSLLTGKIYSAKTADDKNRLQRERLSFLKQKLEETKRHIAEFPSSEVSAYIAKKRAVGEDENTIKSMYDLLSVEVQNSVYGVELKQMLLAVSPTSVGKQAPPFAVPDINGKIHTSDIFMDSNYTLIDFWASWCGPCREENPNLINLYNVYKNKGLVIVGISMDSNKEAWINAIKEDKLPWLQLSDLKKMQSELVKKYAIMSVPMNFLIDKQGKIVARNLRGPELENKLKELMP